MKALVALFTFAVGFGFQANAAEFSLLCNRQDSASCSARAFYALKKLGCGPKAHAVACQDAVTSPSIDPAEAGQLQGKDLCHVRSACQVPKYGNFGQVACRNGQRTVDLKNVDQGLSLTTAVGVFGQFVTVLCK